MPSPAPLPERALQIDEETVKVPAAVYAEEYLPEQSEPG
jgi:hypothetical protein